MPFFDGVIDRLLREHDETIAWSQKSLDLDRQQKKWSLFVLAGVIALTVANAFLLLVIINRAFY